MRRSKATHVTAVCGVSCCQGGEAVAEVFSFGLLKFGEGSLSQGDEIGDLVSSWKSSDSPVFGDAAGSSRLLWQSCAW